MNISPDHLKKLLTTAYQQGFHNGYCDSQEELENNSCATDWLNECWADGKIAEVSIIEDLPAFDLILKNEEYDEQLMQQIAAESSTFNTMLVGLVVDTDNEYKTNQLWLGTLALGEEKTHTQIKLVVTQEPSQTIDED